MGFLIKEYGGMIVTTICAIFILAAVIFASLSIQNMAKGEINSINNTAKGWDVENAQGSDVILSDSDASLINTSINSITGMQTEINDINARQEDSNTKLNTVSDKVDSLPTLDKIYPKDSVYLTIDDDAPSDKFGGSWEKMTDIATGIHAWKRIA